MKCKYCGKEFEKTSNSQKYCSVECRNNDMGYVYRMRKKEKKKAKEAKANASKNPYARILELDAEGQKVGLSYGKYVAANWLREKEMREKETRKKAIDEFAEILCDELSEKTTDILVDGFKFDVLTLDGVVDIVWEIAERMKNGEIKRQMDVLQRNTCNDVSKCECW